jgi:hypothetical protein
MEDVYNELAPDWRGIPTKGVYMMMMTETEVKAIEELIRFAEEYGHEEQEKAIQVVVDYINGLYSTGNIK